MLKVEIWRRDFELEVTYDCYAGEEILEEQKDALEKFSSNKKLIDGSETTVKKYCLEKNNNEIATDKIDNIFKYVMPESIFVKRDGRVAIMCRYKFDMEHGIAVVFKDDKLEQVGTQDIVL